MFVPDKKTIHATLSKLGKEVYIRIWFSVFLMPTMKGPYFFVPGIVDLQGTFTRHRMSEYKQCFYNYFK